MARINLLPWRDERRQVKKREFFATMGAIAALGALLVFGAVWFMNLQNERQDARNARLQDEIKALEKQIEEIKDLEKQKAKLLTKKEIIENLQGDRSLMVHLFDQMARTLPEGVVLETIKQSNESIELQGKAQSEASVAQYMRNLEASAYLKDPDLNVVSLKEAAKAAGGKAQPDMRAVGFRKAFTLKIAVDRPKDPTKLQESEGGTIPDGMPAELGATEMPVDAAAPAAETGTAPAVSTATAPATSGGK